MVSIDTTLYKINFQEFDFLPFQTGRTKTSLNRHPRSLFAILKRILFQLKSLFALFSNLRNSEAFKILSLFNSTIKDATNGTIVKCLTMSSCVYASHHFSSGNFIFFTLLTQLKTWIVCWKFRIFVKWKKLPRKIRTSCFLCNKPTVAIPLKIISKCLQKRF